MTGLVYVMVLVGRHVDGEDGCCFVAVIELLFDVSCKGIEPVPSLILLSCLAAAVSVRYYARDPTKVRV